MRRAVIAFRAVIAGLTRNPPTSNLRFFRGFLLSQE
jgi:hypothetical protein